MKLFLWVLFVVGLLLIRSGITKSNNYMLENGLTTGQAEYLSEKSKEVKDPTHYIKWFVAIQAHEQGSTFVDGKTKYLAGRLKKGMEYKDFKAQLDDRTRAYNKYWYKNNTASDWIYKSKYCVSDTHGGGKGCPNRQKNVPVITKQYQIINHDIGNIKKTPKPTGVKCKIIHTIQNGETLKITNKRGSITKRLKDLRIDDTVAVCK